MSRPLHRAGSSTVDRDAHTHLDSNEPTTSTSTPTPSNSCDPFQLLHYAASLLAENTSYKSDIERLRLTFTTERAILSRLWHLNPSIPIGSLMHLLFISQDRVEQRARLEAVERAWNSAKERVQVVEARESMLSSEQTSSLRDQARPSNMGLGPGRHDHRKGGLQRERTRAQGEIDHREREMTEIRDKLDALDRDEQEYWEMLFKSYCSAHTSEATEVVGRVPLLRDPLDVGIQLPLEAAFTNSSIKQTSKVITVEQDHEILPQDDASLPEIPDSPPSPTIPVPPIPIPLIFDGPSPTDDKGSHWRLSATSNNTNPGSSAGESSLVGPSTPLTRPMSLYYRPSSAQTCWRRPN
ncbi:hypothetical protein BS47DRAFT_617294 [Hydnum rufescens UP504]|uniref:Uncharacterized protein n=1 Tax=Hydnum rufescens UP504 TaxID=1448309 RepID=A0A9P6DWP1_9AGAM|nr:hypothetical protein BS47DRAFT_617294 [Hydnum rufescens UP504]